MRLEFDTQQNAMQKKCVEGDFIMKDRKVSIDKVIAVESILNQIELLQDFGFDSIIILRENSNIKTKDEVISLAGFEDSGIVSLITPGLAPINFELNDMLEINQMWKSDNIYHIDIKLVKGTITILFQITSNMVCMY